MSDAKEYDRVMREQGSNTGKKYRDLTTDQRVQYKWAIPPPPDKRFLQPVTLKVKCGNYEWNVHDELLWTESKAIQEMVKADAKGNNVDLSKYQPELVARMIQYCYFDKYSISPDAEVAPASKTISQVLSENMVTEASSSDVLVEPKFDAALHMSMYILGLNLEMKYLTEYAQKKGRKAVAVEGEGFWACLEMLNKLDDEYLIDKVERRLRHTIEGRVWSTRRPFAELEKARPTMAAQISDMGKRRFGQP